MTAPSRNKEQNSYSKYRGRGKGHKDLDLGVFERVSLVEYGSKIWSLDLL